MKKLLTKIALLTIISISIAIPTAYADLGESIGESIESVEETVNLDTEDAGESLGESIESAVEEVEQLCFTNADCDTEKGYTCVCVEETGGVCTKRYCLKTLKEAVFDVGEWLTLDDDEQEAGYFSDTERIPIVSFILSVINFALRIIGSLAIILIIVAGFMMMFSQGNQQKLDEAKDVVKYAIIGLLVTFFSYLLVIFIQSLFNIQ
jgi:hypothetical protein